MSIVLDDDQDQEYALATRPVSSTVANPFGGTRSNVPAAAAVEEQRAITEVKAAIFMARQNPRDQVRAMDAIIQACSRPTLADVAMYSYSRGGTEITGPSIRLAEALALAWGNNEHGWRELDESTEKSTVQTFGWDYESNVRTTRTFTVKHERHTKTGSKRLTDPRDRYENMANLASRRERACILGIIPRDVVDAAIAQCEATLRSKVKVTPELIESLLAKFAEFGVTRKAIETHIQRRFESITPAQVVALGKKYNSMKDGMSVAADWFEIEPAASTESGTKAANLKAKLEAKTHPAAPTPPAPAPVSSEAANPDDAPPTLENQAIIDNAPSLLTAEPRTSHPIAKNIPPAHLLQSAINEMGEALGFTPDETRNIQLVALDGKRLTTTTYPTVLKLLQDNAEAAVS